MYTESNELVLVISDIDGNIYTLTPELLALGKVNSDEHKNLVRQLVSSEESQQVQTIADAFPQYRVEGAFERSLDPDIRREYAEPQMVVVERSVDNP